MGAELSDGGEHEVVRVCPEVVVVSAVVDSVEGGEFGFGRPYGVYGLLGDVGDAGWARGRAECGDVELFLGRFGECQVEEGLSRCEVVEVEAGAFPGSRGYPGDELPEEADEYGEVEGVPCLVHSSEYLPVSPRRPMAHLMAKTGHAREVTREYPYPSQLHARTM